MTTNINNKFCNNFLTATKKQLGFTFQKQVKDWKRPNVFLLCTENAVRYFRRWHKL